MIMRWTPFFVSMRKFACIFWWLILFSMILVALGMLAYGWLPYSQVKSFVDGLARDGRMDQLTQAIFARTNISARLIGVAFIAGAAGWVIWRKRIQAWLLEFIQGLPGTGDRWWADLKTISRDFKASLPTYQEGIILVIIILLAILVRVAFVSKPMQHDESYTFRVFALQPFKYLVADYHFPNNHIFHTILLRLSYLIFGDAPWAVRLPALLAGVLMVPAAYGLGKTWYNHQVGLLAAGWIALLPQMIGYSTNARGYTLVALFTLLTFGMGVYLLQHNNRAVWALLALFTALGFYTVPTMLYPAGALWLWLFISAILGEARPTYARPTQLITPLIIAGAAAGLLVILFYSPIYRTYGIQWVISNPYVAPLNPETFRQAAPVQVGRTWQEWLTGTPAGFGILLGGGFLLSLLLHRRISRVRVPMQIVLLLFIAIEVLIFRPNLWEKVFTFLTPLWIIWCAAGWVGLVGLISKRNKEFAANLVVGVGLAGAILFTVPYTWAAAPDLHFSPGEVEQTVVKIKEILKPCDIVVFSPPEDAPYWYYFGLYGIPNRHIYDVKQHPFERVFVIVDTNQKGEFRQSLESVLHDRGPDQVFYKASPATELMQHGGMIVYELQANPTGQKKAFTNLCIP